MTLPDWTTLSLAQQIAQLVVVRASGFLFDHQIQYPRWEPEQAKLERWVREFGVGGVLLLGGSAVEVAMRSHQLQDWAAIPLFIAADIEEGVGQRFAGATWFPPPMSLGDIYRRDRSLSLSLAEKMGAITAQEAIAIGLNWVLAPVVDVNINPHNPVINVRAFGEDPHQVTALTQAFIRGAQAYPVLTTAKHFPGHGDTATDSHLDLPVLHQDETRLHQVELLPFQGAIAQRVDTVMTGHLRVPAWDDTYPATFSHTILTDVLRQQMGFDGLIVTDALIMGAIARQYSVAETAILAIEAGVDVLVMPQDPEETIQALCHAVETGRIPLERIHASVDRVWHCKHRVCDPLMDASVNPHAWEQTPPPPIAFQTLAQPASLQTAHQIVQASLHAHVPHPGSMDTATPGWNVVLVDDLTNCPFLRPNSPAIALLQQRGYSLRLLDSHTPPLEPVSGQPIPPNILQLFIRGNPFRSSAALTERAIASMKTLLDAQALQAVVMYGSPYMRDWIQPLLPRDIPWIFTYGQMPAAQRIALEQLWQPDQRATNAPLIFTD
jgi:beta-glucosidase